MATTTTTATMTATTTTATTKKQQQQQQQQQQQKRPLTPFRPHVRRTCSNSSTRLHCGGWSPPWIYMKTDDVDKATPSALTPDQRVATRS